MIACTSPAGTLSDTPFRIGLPATVAWRFSISSMDTSGLSIEQHESHCLFVIRASQIASDLVSHFDGMAHGIVFERDRLFFARRHRLVGNRFGRFYAVIFFERVFLNAIGQVV